MFKKGDPTNADNYRPISILSFFDKILEKLIEVRLSKYYTKFNILTSNQFGFRKGFSTDTAIATFTDKVKSYIDKGDISGAILIDFSKAFDTIDRNILFKKLEFYGITGPGLAIIKSFLQDRYQIVSFNSHNSTRVITNWGVPQGSILGPLLFLTYINDLPLCLSYSSCILYADDTTILSHHPDIDSLISNLQSDLFALEYWCLTNKLSINVSKTCFIPFYSPQRKFPAILPLYINSQPIPLHEKACFLGIIIDTHLKFHFHVVSICKKIAYGVRALLKARHFFNTRTLTCLYFAFVHSHLNYCISSWGGSYNVHVSPLEKIQKQVMRIITFSNWQSPSSPLFTQLNILPLSKLYEYSLATMLFRAINNDLVLDMFPSNLVCNTNNTRFVSQNNLLLPKVRTNYGKQTIAFSAISFWNTLSIDLKNAKSLFFFKKYLRMHLMK